MSPIDFHDVIASLQARVEDIARAYAPGGHVDGGRYWALNPGRGDRKVGSFYVNLAGSHAGRWCDHASGEQGDMLDLIQLATGGDRRAAFREACAFLGIAEETEAQRADRRRQAERASAERAWREADAEEQAKRKRGAAHALWLRGEVRLADTPVAKYLAGRGIRLDHLGRIPHVLRYHPALDYRHVDPDTGEIFEGQWPAMLAAIQGPHVEPGPAAFWGVHRTWLARDPETGDWGKAPVPAPKKVLGSVKGGYIRLWAGFGPRGGKGAPLSKAKPGTRVIVTEGIEDGLSSAILQPELRVACAVSLGNMAEMVLPPAVGHVVMVRDNDDNPKAVRLAEKAIARWMNEGRTVGMWRNQHGGKDLNDALRWALADEEGAA